MHGGGHLVDVLPARALRGGHHLLDLRRVHLACHFLRLGHHGHGGGAGVDASLRLGGRDALHLVRARLVAERGPHAVAFDLDDRLRDASGIACLEFHLVPGPAAALRKPAVHLHEVAGPQRRLVASDAGADLQDHRAHAAVVARHQQALQLGEQGIGAPFHAGKLLACHACEFRVVSCAHRLQFRSLLLGSAPRVPALGHRLQRQALGRERPHAPMVCQHLGIQHRLRGGMEFGGHAVERASEVVCDRFDVRRLRFGRSSDGGSRDSRALRIARSRSEKEQPRLTGAAAVVRDC